MKFNAGIKKVFLWLILISLSPFSLAINIHPDDQAALDTLLQKLGVKESELFINNRRKEISKYRHDIDIEDFYYYSIDGRTLFSFITSKENKIEELAVLWSGLTDLNEVVNFKNIKSLTVQGSKINNLEGIASIKGLKFLDLKANKLLKDLGAVRDLPSLVEFDASTLSSNTIKGMRNLPRLKVFLCEICVIDNIEALGEFKDLEKLTIGTTVKSLAPLKTLAKLREFKVTGNNLTDVSALNGMTSIESIVIYDSIVEEVILSSTLSNLVKFRVVDSKLKITPDFSLFKGLEKISIIRSNLSSVDSIHDLSKLTKLYLAGNKNLVSVNGLNNLPNLKKLELNKTSISSFKTGLLPNLEKLDLSSTHITKLEGFSSFPKLRKLNLLDTKVTSLVGAEEAPTLFWLQTDRDFNYSTENSAILDRIDARPMIR